MSREPIDRVLDFAIFLPIGTALFARDATSLAARTSARLIGKVAAQVATTAVDVLTLDAELPSLVDEPPLDPLDEPLVSPEVVAESTVEPVTEPTETRAAENLPIEGYDHLAARQIVQLLSSLSQDELSAIAFHETANRQRQTVLRKIEQLLAGS